MHQFPLPVLSAHSPTDKTGGGGGSFLRMVRRKVVPFCTAVLSTSFRRGNPLHLRAESYKKLQKLWLGHSVAEEIAHQLESSTQLLVIEWELL